ASDAEKAAFVTQLEVSHQLYNADSPGEKAPWISTNYLENKRRNAMLLRDKGLGAKHRMYEVRGVSHSGGEGGADARRPGDVLDLSRLMDRFIDMLDAWVDRGVAPPPSHSDLADIGAPVGAAPTEHPALGMRETACRLGVYAQSPPSGGGAGTTFFTPFTGDGLEPLDGRRVFVDMNGNGVWDRRETPTEAWR